MILAANYGGSFTSGATKNSIRDVGKPATGWPTTVLRRYADEARTSEADNAHRMYQDCPHQRRSSVDYALAAQDLALPAGHATYPLSSISTPEEPLILPEQ